MTKSIIRPTTSNITDAVAQDGEFKDLFQAINGAGMKLNPNAIVKAVTLFGTILDQEFKGCTQDQALAIIGTVAANLSANILTQIETSQPISNPQRDGRVQAVNRFHDLLLQKAVHERAQVNSLDARAAERIAKMFGPKN